jgi:hypothetical protein
VVTLGVAKEEQEEERSDAEDQPEDRPTREPRQKCDGQTAKDEGPTRRINSHKRDQV